MSPEMILTIAHLVILSIAVAVMVTTIPGVVRRLSSEEATKEDLSRVLRRTVLPLVAFPALACLLSFLTVVVTGYWGDPTPIGVYHTYFDYYFVPGVFALLGAWFVAFVVVWCRRGMPMPEKSN